MGLFSHNWQGGWPQHYLQQRERRAEDLNSEPPSFKYSAMLPLCCGLKVCDFGRISCSIEFEYDKTNFISPNTHVLLCLYTTWK